MTRLQVPLLYLKKQNEKGFTLIEILIVLSITMLFLLFPFMQIRNMEDNQKLKLFLQQFQSDLFLAQQNAMINQERTRVYILNDRYELREPISSTSFVIRKFDPKIHFYYFSMSSIEFGIDGNITKSGKIQVEYKNIIYIITFYLGIGRFSYEKI
jgi:competence protein ComGD